MPIKWEQTYLSNGTSLESLYNSSFKQSLEANKGDTLLKVSLSHYPHNDLHLRLDLIFEEWPLDGFCHPNIILCDTVTSSSSGHSKMLSRSFMISPPIEKGFWYKEIYLPSQSKSYILISTYKNFYANHVPEKKTLRINYFLDKAPEQTVAMELIECPNI